MKVNNTEMSTIDTICGKVNVDLAFLFMMESSNLFL